MITGGKAYEVRHTLVEQGEPIRAWDLEDPRRYTLRSELIVDGKVTDTLYTRFGFRTLRYTADEGFFLNGQPDCLAGCGRRRNAGGADPQGRRCLLCPLLAEKRA